MSVAEGSRVFVFEYSVMLLGCRLYPCPSRPSTPPQTVVEKDVEAHRALIVWDHRWLPL